MAGKFPKWVYWLPWIMGRKALGQLEASELPILILGEQRWVKVYYLTSDHTRAIFLLPGRSPLRILFPLKINLFLLRFSALSLINLESKCLFRFSQLDREYVLGRAEEQVLIKAIPTPAHELKLSVES